MQKVLVGQPSVAIRRVHAVVNPLSGGVGAGAAGELAALFEELGLEHRITELDPGRAEDGVRAAIDEGPDLIVVLGGDGTARLVAETCGADGPLVAPLSGGTINRLGRALYGSRPWRDVLPGLLAHGTARWMPALELDGRLCFCRAVLGPPALLARAREAIRTRALGRAWRQAVFASRKARVTRLRFDLDEDFGRALAVALICPTLSDGLDESGDVLEAAILDPPDARSSVRLALNGVFGEWRNDPQVPVVPCRRARVWARNPIPATLDGEFFLLPREVEGRLRRRGFRALAAGARP